VVAVLGNPVTEERLRELVSIRKPYFYQMSLEGLKDRNDWVRGEGHFERTLEFLPLLGRFWIYRMVMLTLTESNFRDVIPVQNSSGGRQIPLPSTSSRWWGKERT